MSLSINDKMPDFNLPNVDGSSYSAEDLTGSNATVVMFWCNHCPYVVPNQDRIIAMQDEYKDKGVKFIAIGANNADTHPADSFENMKLRAEEKGYNFPYLRDESQAVAKRFGAQRTPEVFLFDSNQQLKYHGRIDDNHEDVSRATSHDLRNAIDAVLSGREPDPAETGAMGCTIKWK